MGRASRSKRAAATARPVRKPEALVPITPRVVDGLSPTQVVAVQRLQALELERRDLERQLDELVLKSRRAGMPWAAIGWALGVSGQAVSQRFGKRL